MITAIICAVCITLILGCLGLIEDAGGDHNYAEELFGMMCLGGIVCVILIAVQAIILVNKG